MIDEGAVELVIDADLDLFETVQNIEFGQRDPIDPGGLHGLPHKHGVEPATAPPPPRIGAEFMATIADQLAGLIGEFGRKGPPPTRVV